MCISICRSGRWVIWKSMFDIKTISLDGKCLHNPTISFISRFFISLLAGSTNSQARIPWKISTIFVISICCTNFLLDRLTYCFSVNPLLVHLWLQFLCLHDLMLPLMLQSISKPSGRSINFTCYKPLVTHQNVFISHPASPTFSDEEAILQRNVINNHAD